VDTEAAKSCQDGKLRKHLHGVVTFLFSLLPTELIQQLNLYRGELKIAPAAPGSANPR
jgi:hypothetical protein